MPIKVLKQTKKKTNKSLYVHVVNATFYLPFRHLLVGLESLTTQLESL